MLLLSARVEEILLDAEITCAGSPCGYAWGVADLIGIVIRKCAPRLALGSTEI